MFKKLGCLACHAKTSAALGPDLAGTFGTTRTFQDNTEGVADENYLRESILNPQAKLVQGYQPVMPAFQGLVTEDQLAQLIEAGESLGDCSVTIEAATARPRRSRTVLPGSTV